MKRVLACAWILVLLTGCRGALPYAREMGDTALLRTVGLDRAQSGVELTVSTAGRFGDEEALVLSAVGRSIPSAAQTVQSLGDRYVYYGHVDQMLLGEELAAGGIADVIDHLARESELGLGIQMWVIRGGTAAQAIGTAGNRGVPERLDQLNTDSRIGAANLTRTAAELMTVLAREGSTWLPALEWVEAREADGGTGQGTLIPNGYGIVRQGRLVCWVEDDAARGVELLEEQAFGRVSDLMLEDGTGVSLTTDRVSTTFQPVFRDGELTGIEVFCRLSVRVTQTGRRLSAADLEWLQFRLELLEGGRMVQAIEQGQYWDADYLGLERKVQMACPHRKAAIQEQWPGAFRGLDVRVEVHAEVERSFGSMDTVG